jgi:hypothetical protein
MGVFTGSLIWSAFPEISFLSPFYLYLHPFSNFLQLPFYSFLTLLKKSVSRCLRMTKASVEIRPFSIHLNPGKTFVQTREERNRTFRKWRNMKKRAGK